jgi:hypothetical protein
MKQLYVLILLVFCLTANAQMISYNSNNRTEKLSPFKLSATVGGDNILPQYGGMLEGVIANRIYYDVIFRRDMIRNYLIDKDELRTTNPEVKTNYFEGGIEIFLKRKVNYDGTRLKIVTSQEQYDDVISTNYFMAPADQRNIFSLRGGAYYYNRNFYSRDKNGRYLVSGNDTLNPSGSDVYHTNTLNAGLYAGLSWRTIVKTKITALRFYWLRYSSVKYFADFMYGKTSTDVILLNNISYDPENTPKSPWGWRFGIVSENQGTSTMLEFGMRPTVHNKYKYFNYFLLSFSFNIIGNDKNYKLKNI